MAIITTGSFAKALWPGVNAWYGKSYSEYPVEHDKLFDKYSSRKAWEEDVGTTSFGLAFLKGEGASVQFDTEQQGFVSRYTHAEYALGFIITKNMVEDDLYDVVGERKAKSLAYSMRQTKETVAANVYNRAFNANYLGGDGLEMCSLLHINVAGGTWANELATAADISEAALEQALIDISGFTNDRGLKIAVRAKNIIVPKELDFEINKILKTEYEVGTANNTVNIVRGRFPGGVTVNHYLTDTDAWFIRTDAPHGLKHFERRADSFGWTDPRAIFASPGG